jgi:type VI secretion system Hcp family effector
MVTIQGHANEPSIRFDCISISYSAKNPENMRTGKAADETAGKSIIIEKKLDSFSPQLRKIMISGEKLNSVIIELHKKGQAPIFETIHLSDAIISKVVTVGGAQSPRETITIDYRKIETTTSSTKKIDI